MKLYLLRGFETYTYSTHTMFIATTRERALELCNDVTCKLLMYLQGAELDTDSDEGLALYSLTGSFDDCDYDTILSSLYGRLEIIESDKLISDAVIDGD